MEDLKDDIDAKNAEFKSYNDLITPAKAQAVGWGTTVTISNLNRNMMYTWSTGVTGAYAYTSLRLSGNSSSLYGKNQWSTNAIPMTTHDDELGTKGYMRALIPRNGTSAPEIKTGLYASPLSSMYAPYYLSLNIPDIRPYLIEPTFTPIFKCTAQSMTLSGFNTIEFAFNDVDFVDQVSGRHFDWSIWPCLEMTITLPFTVPSTAIVHASNIRRISSPDYGTNIIGNPDNDDDIIVENNELHLKKLFTKYTMDPQQEFYGVIHVMIMNADLNIGSTIELTMTIDA